jgi:hypothetical protein
VIAVLIGDIKTPPVGIFVIQKLLNHEISCRHLCGLNRRFAIVVGRALEIDLAAMTVDHIEKIADYSDLLVC